MANDWNDKIIAEFRENGGDVASFGKQPLLLLHTVGAKSGEGRVNPLACLVDGDRLCVFASFAGRPENPAWYHNLKANSKVKVEVGTETYERDRDRGHRRRARRDLRAAGRVQPRIRRVRGEDDPGHPGDRPDSRLS